MIWKLSRNLETCPVPKLPADLPCAECVQQRAAAMSEGVLSSKKRPADPMVTDLPLSPKKLLAYVCELQHGVGTGLHVHNVLPPSSKGLLAYVCELQDAVGTGLQRAATQKPEDSLFVHRACSCSNLEYSLLVQLLPQRALQQCLKACSARRKDLQTQW